MILRKHLDANNPKPDAPSQVVMEGAVHLLFFVIGTGGVPFEEEDAGFLSVFHEQHKAEAFIAKMRADGKEAEIKPMPWFIVSGGAP